MLWAVVPAKDPAHAKSRLARTFTQAQRRAISLGLLERTLRMLRQTPVIAQYLVVSAAAEPLALARCHGAQIVQEAPRAAGAASGLQVAAEAGMVEEGLNAALHQAATVAAGRGVGAIVVLPADLPCLTPAALTALAASLPAVPGIVLAPDRRHGGTNALLAAPPLALPFSFGGASFMRHREIAARHGMPVAVFDHPAFALDLDEPDDVEALIGRSPGVQAAEHEGKSSWRMVRAILTAGDRLSAPEYCA